MNDLPMLAREDYIRIATEVWPIFAETNRSAAVRLVRAVLHGEPCRAAPSEAARIRELAALAVSRAPAARRVRAVDLGFGETLDRLDSQEGHRP
jgi:hypothetical protein